MLKIKIRKHQLINKQAQNVVLQCSGQNKATYVLGNNPDTTWYDITDGVSGLDDLEFIIKKDDLSRKLSERSSSMDISLVGEASEIVQDWLFGTPCSYLNYFDVEITDTSCDYTYARFELKPDNMSWCDKDGCYFTLPLRESDEASVNLKKYSIHDNWQKWYSEDGTKEHPTFEVVIFNTVPLLQATIIGMYLFVTSLPGIGWLINYIGNIHDTIKENLGFGRFAAAPYVRDILKNITDKVGLQLDTIFDAGQSAANDCLFIPYGGSYFKNMNGCSPSRKHIWNNRYIWQYSEFLDSLCELYNCYWEIAEGKLIIKPLAWKINETPIDISDQVESNCYAFDLSKKSAYGRYEYQADPTDAASNSVQLPYNDIVDFDGQGNNPMLEGNTTRQVKFASTGFYGDSFGQNNVDEIMDLALGVAYIMLATLVITAASLIAGTVTATGAIIISAAITVFLATVVVQRDNYKAEFGVNSSYKGIVRIQGSGALSVPRILRYDPATPLNCARVVKQSAASIQINSYYNLTNTAYANQPWGASIYQGVTDVFNYPLYFDANYKGNLYDTYHEYTDNPLIVNIGNKELTTIIPFCCDNIDIVGLGPDSQRLVGKVVKVKDGEYILVHEVTVSYKDMSITIKGKILYK